jgi:putative addiction module CopG family antidote
MNISLTPKLEMYIKGKVASGLYNNASEVIREALRLLFEREGNAAANPIRKTPRKSNIVRRLASLEKPLRARGITSLALFGSALHGRAGPDSDVDLLIDVAPGLPFSLVDLVDLQDFLQDQLGHRVDVVTRSGLDSGIRGRVLREAEGIF